MVEINIDMELVDDILAEDFLTSNLDDAYDRWRDDQCEALESDLKELVDKHLYPKTRGRGYYKDMPEKFLEHAIESLKQLTNCNLTAFENSVNALRKPINVEVVESFEEEKNEDRIIY